MVREYKNYFLDTNFICSLLNIADSNNYLAEEIFLKLPKNKKLITSEVVLLELASQKMLAYRKITDFLESYKVKQISLNRKIIDGINHFYLQNNILLKPIDLSVFFLSIKYQAKLLTFDEKLLKHLDKHDYKY